ncbi:MAG: pantoate--beta-alanine ligase, partial [Methylophilaceae bacterium]
MKIFKSISSIQKYLSKQSQIAFIPTMGNLHQGHLSLIQKAKKPKTCIVVSIFVNRL